MHSGHFINAIIVYLQTIYLSKYLYQFILSEFTNVVNNGADNGWSTIFSKFKKNIPEISKEISDCIDLLNCDPDSKLWDTEELISFAKECDIADKEFLKFLSTSDSSGDLMKLYQQHLNSAPSSTAKFGATLKSMAANVTIIDLISLAIRGVQYAWDKTNTSISEVTGRIYELSDSISWQDLIIFMKEFQKKKN